MGMNRGVKKYLTTVQAGLSPMYASSRKDEPPTVMQSLTAPEYPLVPWNKTGPHTRIKKEHRIRPGSVLPAESGTVQKSAAVIPMTPDWMIRAVATITPAIIRATATFPFLSSSHSFTPLVRWSSTFRAM